MLEQMLAGVSTRRFERTREPVGDDIGAAERSASKSAASRVSASERYQCRQVLAGAGRVAVYGLASAN